MTELGKRIVNILQKKSSWESDKERLLKEIQQMEDLDILQDVWTRYERVQKNPDISGTRNDPNSLLAYYLDITKEKPEEEFKNEKRRTYGRDGWPDIDMDFCDDRRHEIVNFLVGKYGRSRVASIGTVQTLKSKAALRRVIKALDPEKSINYTAKKPDQSGNFALQNEILGTLPKILKKRDGTLLKNLQEVYNEFNEFAAYMRKYPQVFETAKRMEGNISSSGIHPGGIILSPVDLSTLCPLHTTRGTNEDGQAGASKAMVTQFTMQDVESLGLIKIDVLGVSTLTTIDFATKLVKNNYGIDIDLSDLPLDDPLVLELYNSGKTDGIFQCEEAGMKQALQQIQINSFDDLMLAVAMYRPGPKDYIPQIAKRKQNPNLVQYAHPIVEKHTKSTYGIIVYQESAMHIFVELAGLTPTEGYTFIKGAAKKKPELFMSMKARFIKGASKISNKQVAESVWRQMEPFQGYAFCAGHSYAYAYLSWKTAYLKAHYPVEFICARLTEKSRRRKTDIVYKYEQDAIKNFGITIHPADLNRSKLTYIKIGEKDLLRPLLIKDVGDKAAEEIIRCQPFDPDDLLYSFGMKVGGAVNTKIVEVLASAKMFGNIPKPKVLSIFEAIKAGRQKSKGRQTGNLKKGIKGTVKRRKKTLDLDF